MGYYVTLTGAEFFVPENEETLAHMKDIVSKYKKIQRGGSMGPGGMRETWFSWVMDSDILEAPSVEAIFNLVGFDTTKENNGFQIDGYNSKQGQEEVFLAHIAPFVANGSYVEFRGEDMEVWKYEVIDGKLHTFHGYTVTKWEKPEVTSTYYHHIEGLYGTPEHISFSMEVNLYEDIDAQIEAALAEYKRKKANQNA